MTLLLGLVIFTFIINSLLFIPFINFLYQLKFQRQKQETRDFLGKLTPIFDRFNAYKAGIPIGGGILILTLIPVIFLSSLFLMKIFWLPITGVYPIQTEIKIILFTFLSFGFLGFYDDYKKIFVEKEQKFFGLRLRHKLILELVLSAIISYWLYSQLKIGILNIPFLGFLDLGVLYIPFAAFVITAFANAYNITDGLDGLAGGLLAICLMAFCIVSAGILDAPLSIFMAIWIGSLISFLYFNIHPARIFLGDTGALSFGATMAVIGLLLGKTIALVIIGGIFVAEAAFSLIQLSSKSFFNRKVFAAAPLHLWFQQKGWAESTVVMRFWLVGIILAVLGLFLASMT